MESKAAIKVGVMVLAGAALFGAGWWFLSHGLYGMTHYRIQAVFKDTKGLLRQTPVRMNGVTVGEVEKIELSNDPDTRLLPVVTLAIERKYHIPKDSTIGITSGLLISNPQIEIRPGKQNIALAENARWPRDKVQEPAGGLAQISPEADSALKELSATVKEIRPKLVATIDGLQGILNHANGAMVNLEKTTASASSLIGDPKLKQTMRASLDDLQAMSKEARTTAKYLGKNLRELVKRNSGKFDELANSSVDLLQKLADTVDAARSAVTRLTEQVSDPRIQQSLLETLDLAKTTIARFNQIASDIHQLTGDPSVQGDFKATVTTLRETAEQVKPLIERVNTIVAQIKLPTGGPRFGIGTPRLAIDLLGRSNPPHFRSDVSLRVPIGKTNAFNLGLYDFAERYKLNAQYETILGSGGSLRYGVYASKLGVGMDWQSAPFSRFVIDAYDPNNLKVDARGLFKLNNDFALWLGADSIFKHTTPLMGLRLQR